MSREELLALIYDWNVADGDKPIGSQVRLHDETLRDGIQGPSVTDPTIEDKIAILHDLNELGVYSINVGLPGSGERAEEHCLRLCQEIEGRGLAIKASCAARTTRVDIEPIARLSQAAGIGVEVMAFVGSSAMRWLAEDWSLDLIKQRTEEAIEFARREGLSITYVTEDTTRSTPETLGELFRAAIGAGAHRLCLCDTVGHATPNGVRALLRFTKELIAEAGVEVGVDWHGHNDRGLALENALWAAELGADRIHGCVLGIGERSGNTPLDLLLVNMRLLGAREDPSLQALTRLCQRVSECTGVAIPDRYPVVGRDAFRTSTGVHAAAIVKAAKKGMRDLSDAVYSGVPASLVGRAQEICIGPMSGASNVSHWLEQHGIDPNQHLVQAILTRAKSSNHVLSEDTIMEVVKAGTRTTPKSGEISDS